MPTTARSEASFRPEPCDLRAGRPRALLGIGGPLVALALAVALAPGAAADGADLDAPFDGAVRHPRVAPADFLHLRADLRLDWETESVAGEVEHRLRARKDGLRTVVLDAVDIECLDVRDGEGRPLEHRAHDDRLEIDLAAPLAAGEEASFTVRYRCRPLRGVWFIQPIEEYPDRPRQAWTQGETEDTRHWIPCFDAPSERITSELLLTVPQELDVLSNGVRVDDEANDDGTHTVHWRIDKPHVAYLICFAAGPYERIEETWDGIPLAFWHDPGDAERARLSFEETREMMGFFSERFGRYPWSKYDQVVVRDFIVGGMENTTATLLTEHTLHRAQHEPHVSSRGLVAHELAHQWFGDLVTCRDWADIWLNESFATFSAALWVEHALGRPDAQIVRRGQWRSYRREDRRYRRPLSCKTYREPGNMFDRHSYPKGARILEMLRQHLGDADFFRGLRCYLERHAHRSVETQDLRRALEDACGEPLGWFFEQWVHHGGHPELRVRESWDPERSRLSLRVEQTQEVDGVTPLYRLPVEVGIFLSGPEPRVERVLVESEDHTFTFSLPARPSFVRFDRRSVLLADIDHEKPRSAWLAQLSRDPDTLGRVRAAEALGRILDETGDVAARDRLIERLETEAFWAVRRSIAEALGEGGGAPAREALAACLAANRHPRVREEAAQSLARLGLPDAVPALERAFEEDPSIWVRRASLRAVRSLDAERGRVLARRALDVPSRRGMLRRAAIGILRELEDRESVPELLELAAPGAPREAREAAIRALGELGEGRDEVVDALLAQLDDPHRGTRRTVIGALGASGAEKARPALAERRTAERRESLRDAVDRAIERLERPDGLDDLRRQVAELRAAREDLEERVRELEESGTGVDEAEDGAE